VDEAAFRRLVSGESTGPLAGLSRFGLRLLSVVYACVSLLRNQAFDVGLKKQHRVGVPVISVGNLTTGGTGKTPIVAWLVNRLRDVGRCPVILSRGYRSIDGDANDEKLLLDQLCPGVTHLQNPDRVVSARQAIENDNADVLVLDDGFQHRRIARDFNIVLVDATCPFGYGYQLPRGLLRESTRSLDRADLVLITRTDQCEPIVVQQITHRIRRLNDSLPVVATTFRPVQLRNSSGETRSFASLDGSTIAAFCAIGNPDGFRQTLTDIGLEPEWLERFSDHHHYSEQDQASLMQRAEESKIDVLLTTQKDLVKIQTDRLAECPLWAIEIAAMFKDEEAIKSSLANRLPTLFAL
jgi:tetraacyldisaccharide 4'-kinase